MSHIFDWSMFMDVFIKFIKNILSVVILVNYLNLSLCQKNFLYHLILCRKYQQITRVH